jgi:hypothetical protein
VGVQIPPLAPNTADGDGVALSQSGALRILEEEHESVRELAEGLRNEDFERRATIGGGDWSAKDLLGHLTSWEEHALEALKAWRRGEPAPVQRALRVHGLNAVNAESVAADRNRSSATVRRRFDDVQRRMVAEIRSMPGARRRRAGVRPLAGGPTRVLPRGFGVRLIAREPRRLHPRCLVREGGFEPPRPCGHRILSPARLPGSATLAELSVLVGVYVAVPALHG